MTGNKTYGGRDGKSLEFTIKKKFYQDLDYS